MWGIPALSNRKYFEPMQAGKQQTTSSTDFYFYFSGVIAFSFKALQSRQSADGFGSPEPIGLRPKLLNFYKYWAHAAF